MATRTLTLDPVTRIEGHLRVDVELQDDRVTRAWTSAQMWRGLEVILRGRSPEDAWVFAQRFCGICTTVHAIASVRAVEHALGVDVPLNAQYIRNLMIAQHAVQDHLVHFYHLAALDWIDLSAAAQADPGRAAGLAQSLSAWPGNSAAAFRAVQDRLRALLGSGQPGLFAAGYGGHPAMRLTPEANLMVAAHYLEAFDYQRKAAQAIAVLGGKNPHVQNLVIGGVATALNLDNLATINMERLAFLRTLLEEVRAFVAGVYYPDLLAIARAYPEWFRLGAGVTRYLAVPEFPEDTQNRRFALPGGLWVHGTEPSLRPIPDHRDATLMGDVRESVARAWYEPAAPLHPWDGETRPAYTGFEADGRYTWCKAPRLGGQPVQVGPIAQVLVSHAAGHPEVRALVDEANAALGIGLPDYHSTLGRFLARGMRARLMADLSLNHLDRLTANLGAGDRACANPVPIPDGEYRGVGFHEAPRGALSHWIVIRDRKIHNYQAVVPTTWNASPRDEEGAPGPCEASLAGLPVADPEKPLEVLRTIHSFDPCVACAVHTFDPAGREVTRVRVR
jgi:hydrogenase large subunit